MPSLGCGECLFCLALCRNFSFEAAERKRSGWGPMPGTQTNTGKRTSRHPHLPSLCAFVQASPLPAVVPCIYSQIQGNSTLPNPLPDRSTTTLLGFPAPGLPTGSLSLCHTLQICMKRRSTQLTGGKAMRKTASPHRSGQIKATSNKARCHLALSEGL